MTNFSSDLTTHPSLLLRVRDAENHQAWSDFVAVYGPLVYSFCRRRGLQESDAADISQEVLARVAAAIGAFEYQREKGRFRGWLGTITFRELARFTKGSGTSQLSNRTDEPLPEIAAQAGSTTQWDDHFHASLLQVAMERIQADFEPANWQAFVGVWIELQSADMVANRLGITVDKVYVAKSRILKRLREVVLSLSEDAPLK